MLLLGLGGEAGALGLGELDVNSALFQPLEAEITLHGWERISLDNLRAGLASQNAFLRANVDRPYFLRELRMEVAREPDGRAVIRVTSRQPVREPMLEFLIDVEWPGGRMQKQYTILLDPPVAPTVAVSTASGGTASVVTPPPGAAPDPAAAPPPPAPPLIAAPATATGEPASPPMAAAPTLAPAPTPASYQVRRNDTLGAIARQLRPDGVSLNQTMMALLEANPDAFVDRNINYLKGGVELTVPAREAMLALSATDATAQVRAQYAAWRERNRAATAVAEAPEPGGLRLVPTVPEPVVAPPTDSTAVAEKSLVEQELENTRALLYEREAELDVMRSRMAVYESELQDMKDALAELRERAESAAGATEPATVAAAAPAPPARSIDMTPVLAALLLALGGFGLVTFFYRRWRARRATTDSEAVTTAVPLELTQALDISERVRPAPAGAIAEVARAGVAAPHEAPYASGPHAAATISDTPTPTEVREMVPDDAATGDRMLIEADVLIQFGFYQRGHSLMTEALRAEPDNNEYRLKLLELAHALGDSDEFLQQAQVLRDNLRPGQESLWHRACELGRQQCPDAELFREAVKVEIGEPPAGQTDDATPTSAAAPLGENGEFVNLDDLDGRAEWEFAAPGIETLDDDQPTMEVPGVDGAEPSASGDETREWLIPDEALRDPFLGEVLADAAREQHEKLAATQKWETSRIPPGEEPTDEWQGDGTAEDPAVTPEDTGEYPATPAAPDPDAPATGEWSLTSEYPAADAESPADSGDGEPTREWRIGTGLREAIMGNVDADEEATREHPHATPTAEHPSAAHRDPAGDDADAGHGSDAGADTQEWSAQRPAAETDDEVTREWHAVDRPGHRQAPPDAGETAEYPTPDDIDRTQEIEPLVDPEADADEAQPEEPPPDDRKTHRRD